MSRLSYSDRVLCWILDALVKTCPGFLSQPVHDLQWWWKSHFGQWYNAGVFILAFYLVFLLSLAVGIVAYRRFLYHLTSDHPGTSPTASGL